MKIRKLKNAFLLFYIFTFSSCEQPKILDEDEVKIYLIFSVPHPYGLIYKKEERILDIFHDFGKKLPPSFNEALLKSSRALTAFVPKEALSEGNYYIEIYDANKILKYNYKIFSPRYVYDMINGNFLKCNILTDIYKITTIEEIKEKINEKLVAMDAVMPTGDAECQITMIKIVGKYWYSGLTGSESRW